MLAGWWCNGEKVTGCLQESIRFLLFWAPTCTVNRSSAAILVTVSQTDRRLEATTWKTLINEMKRILCLHWLDLKFDPAQKTHKVKCASTNWTLAASYPQKKPKKVTLSYEVRLPMPGMMCGAWVQPSATVPLKLPCGREDMQTLCNVYQQWNKANQILRVDLPG